MALAPISSGGSTQGAFGLDFQALLSIILTQLTYQDPLKPVDNFQFVSQLAQFSQLQQSQTLNDQISSLLAAQGASQATSLLGRTIDFTVSGTTLSGEVEGVSFTSGEPTVTIRTSNDQVISGVSIADIGNVRL
ncbi:flagellar hook assembly protein FlgD [Brevundimonas sp.]|uniref:flagellar hook assembly protein FlgD n=1 Tax=Brevundimonas sp. TaxID=1871086 RepID=UPI002D6CF9CF|nr:flagellar hook capping FlgD N-terminal domain-containing protein [Brevundimonas sp.]HYC68866.1 flagellar hook capping FlgD N-terminal domain-containing protein [Brevundimonas sp.]